MARAKAKTIWARSGVGSLCDRSQQRMVEHLNVRGQQREALIDNFVLAAEPAHFAIPAEARIAAVLHKGGHLSFNTSHVLEMLQ